jgi:NAD(P)-dependent dehydrogenase (short-subunit alcohol dehydrogenase family)
MPLTALVTGSASGIGEVVAKALASCRLPSAPG